MNNYQDIHHKLVQEIYILIIIFDHLCHYLCFMFLHSGLLQNYDKHNNQKKRQ